jgi:hypothetical protein
VDRDDIIRIAKEAGAKDYGTGEEGVTALMIRDEAIERFAELVAAHERKWCAKVCAELRKMAIAEEREECAKVADAWQSAIHDPRYECDCADAIRARGEK